MKKKVFATVDDMGQVTRIFKNKKAATFYDTMQMDRGNAVASIRRQVLKLQGGRCIKCHAPISWETMHMDEIHSKGTGGEVSLANCQGLCADCHIGPHGKHSDRTPQFGKGKR